MTDSRLFPVVVILAVSAPALVHGAGVRSPQTDRSLLEAMPTTETTLARDETARAQSWGLSEIEWRRYESLMQGIRGSVSPSSISPIEVLGIHARDEAERRRYAERWAQAMWEDAERILAFQRAYVEAGRRLYPNVPLIDPSRLPGKGKQTTELQTKDRVLLFTRPNCPPCDALLARVLERIEQVAGIDIYLAGIEPGDDRAVREWAARHGIEPEWVRKRKVTLNFEAGALAALTDRQAQTPTLMRRRADAVSLLSPAGF